MKISEHEMILAFLQAETRSPRFSHKIKIKEKLIFRPNLNCEIENAARKTALAKYRGYSKDKLLFENFPEDVVWYRKTLSRKKLNTVYYLNHPDPIEQAGGTRKLIDGARNLNRTYKRGFTENILDVAKQIKQGMLFPEPILVEHKNKLYIVEGHTRLTAFAWLAAPSKISVIIGKSKLLKTWVTQAM